jgi:hypothetical protein
VEEGLNGTHPAPSPLPNIPYKTSIAYTPSKNNKLNNNSNENSG